VYSVKSLVFLMVLGSLALAQRIAVLGDWGADSPFRPQIAAAMRATHQQKPLEAIVTLGDNFYPSGVPVRRFVDDLPKLRIYPTFGNHDISALEAQFKLFGLDRTYYNVTLGNIEFFVLYSEGFDMAQRAWLESALRASSAPWKVVTLHRPLYSSGLYGGSHTLRQALEPLLTKYQVNLVLAGHEHDYERSQAKGITHIVSGGGGAWLRGFIFIRPQSKFHQETHSYLVLEATPEQLSITAYNAKNNIIDQTMLQR